MVRRIGQFLITVIALLGFSYSASAETLFVQVSATKLRSAPQAWASGIEDLSYGAALDVVEENSGWYKVRAGDAHEGYIHGSAVSKRKIVLRSEQKSVADLAVDEASVSLAGKGFGTNIEATYTKSAKDSNYEAVNRIQSAPRVPDAKIASFVKDGRLHA
jgi:hypothetical protein